MWPKKELPSAAEVSAASILLLPFALLLVVLSLGRPVDPNQLLAADPLIQLLGGQFWIVPLSAAVTAAAWLASFRPNKKDLHRSMAWALVGALAACAVAGAIRLVVGNQLPAFIPPEESAKPGLLLGLSAGVLEEVVFRLVVLPLSYVALRKRVPRTTAMFLAVIATSLLFAGSHELGQAAGDFELGYFVTRFLLPGVAMSMVFFRLSPSFIIVAHVTAHLVIPLLFR